MNSKLAVGLTGLSLLLSLCAVLLSGVAWRATQNTNAAQATAELPRMLELPPTQPSPASDRIETATPKIHPPTSQPLANSASITLPSAAAVATAETLEQEAERVANGLIELLPDNANALHVLAILKAQLHKTSEAAELWKRCLELDPEAEPYYLNFAAIAIERGENQLAIDTLRAAAAHGIASAEINHHLGIALNSVGQFAEAAAVAQDTLDKQPSSGAHWFILGRAQLQQGLFAEAEVSLKRALELGSHSKELYFALFNVCMRQGKKAEALEFKQGYDAFKEVKIDLDERYKILSEAEARRICVSVLAEAGVLYHALQDLQMTEHLLLRVLALEPKNLTACQELAEVYDQRGEPANEIVIRQRIIQLDPSDLLHYLMLAKTQVRAGAPQLAEAQIKLAISLAPQIVTGYAAMAEFQMELDQPQTAQWYVEQALRLKPTVPGYKLLAETLAAQGKVDESKLALDMAQQLTKSQQSKAIKK